VAKGMDIEMAPFDEDHVRAKITWSEQDVGGGKLVAAQQGKARRDDRLADLDHHNAEPKPFVWTASAAAILEKVARGRQVLESVH
jgi:hypothetical protein